jgi:hypothetical protein
MADRTKNLVKLLSEYDDLTAQRAALSMAWSTVDWDDASAVVGLETKGDDIKADEAALLHAIVAELRS